MLCTTGSHRPNFELVGCFSIRFAERCNLCDCSSSVFADDRQKCGLNLQSAGIKQFWLQACSDHWSFMKNNYDLIGITKTLICFAKHHAAILVRLSKCRNFRGCHQRTTCRFRPCSEYCLNGSQIGVVLKLLSGGIFLYVGPSAYGDASVTWQRYAWPFRGTRHATA